MNQVLECLKNRRSCRSYESKKISTDEMNQILEAGTYAPTGMGKQSPIIVVVQEEELISELEKINASVLGKEEVHTFYGAPNLIIVFADSSVPFGLSDANLVIGNMLNAASAIGVDSCYIWRAKESFETDLGKELKRKWNIPNNYFAAGNIVLGYGKKEGIRAPSPRKKDYIRYV